MLAKPHFATSSGTMSMRYRPGRGGRTPGRSRPWSGRGPLLAEAPSGVASKVDSPAGAVAPSRLHVDTSIAMGVGGRTGSTGGALDVNPTAGGSVASRSDEFAFIDEVPKTSVGKFDKKALRHAYTHNSLDVIHLPR